MSKARTKKKDVQTSKMAQWVKVLATESEDLSLIPPGIHMVGGMTCLYTRTCGRTHTHTPVSAPVSITLRFSLETLGSAIFMGQKVTRDDERACGTVKNHV